MGSMWLSMEHIGGNYERRKKTYGQAEEDDDEAWIELRELACQTG